MLPAENATGNYVKVVQRVPVKIVFDNGPAPTCILGPGMPVVPTVQSAMAAQPPAAGDLSRSAAGDRNPGCVAVVISIATFMEVLDISIANVALQNIAGSLAAGIDESTWVLTSYLVASAVILPISGWLSGIIGRKRFYMMCVATFTREPGPVRDGAQPAIR